ncbi:ribosomal protection-like ABC-F family protein [Bacillus fonticola]|uniref:ribosomal protection-like ABC-F family protein n=1 Tax=Bacillus fonticola TaxID=2728853 RepID=UPI0014759F8D|nr:ABC-F family ATP-binding cassette domain-containing protein [Bacillus fonticola]
MICQLNNITLSNGYKTVLDHISMHLQPGDRIGLIGRNGVGKTTLLNILTKTIVPDSGEIILQKGSQIGYLQQTPDIEETLTVEAVLQTARKDLSAMETEMHTLEVSMASATERQLDSLLSRYARLQEQYANDGGYESVSRREGVAKGLGIDKLLSQPFSSCSGGEKTKIMLALLLLEQHDLLLLDEPTNHLDMQAVEWLEEFLLRYAGAVMIVTHDRFFLDKVTTKIAELENGDLTFYDGNYSRYVIEKEERVLRQFQQFEEQQKKIKQMKEAIKRLRRWANEANPPNPGLHRRARHMERMLERMEKVEKPLEGKQMGLSLSAHKRSANDVFQVKGGGKLTEDNVLWQDLNLLIRYQQHTAVVGGNGVGKTTLLRVFLDKTDLDEGEVKIGSNVRIGYLSQEFPTDEKVLAFTVLEYFRQFCAYDEGKSRHVLAKFLFFGQDVFKPVSRISGGEYMRLQLATLMHQPFNVLLLDEPTNHLDIESKEVLEEALQDYDGTIVAVSHDRYFLSKLFQQILWLEKETGTVFIGNFVDAYEKKREQR